jgi:hypothetical protein
MLCYMRQDRYIGTSIFNFRPIYKELMEKQQVESPTQYE